jgi:sugar/nucleoside kinase (ribokinase family)
MTHDLVYVSGYGLAYPESGPALAGWLARLENGVTVVVDPGPLVAEIPRSVLRAAARCTWWTCNEREARLMTGAAIPNDSIRGQTADSTHAIFAKEGPLHS